MIRDIDDAIDAWHALPSSPPPCPLHEWLGMTWDEYRAWAESPAAVLPTRRPADVPPMARRARRAFRRSLPTCRAVHADASRCGPRWSHWRDAWCPNGRPEKFIPTTPEPR